MLRRVESFQPSTWGEHAAEIYDDLAVTKSLVLDEAVEVLFQLARGGRVLELAVGNGRLALPLAERGLEVHGIDASPAMLEQLRARPGGERVHVHLGDFADVALDGTFPLVFCAAYTFFSLTTPEDQLRCFRNVARHLTDDGLFVIEAWVPTARRGDSFSIHAIEPDRLEISFWRHDPLTQVLDSMYLVVTEGGIRLIPSRDRETPPGELDLMAQLAGLSLRERWEGWDRERFSGESGDHVSLYARARSPA